MTTVRSRNAFAIERRGAESSDHGAVVDDSHVVAGNFSPSCPPESERRDKQNSVDAFENVPRMDVATMGSARWEPRRLHLTSASRLRYAGQQSCLPLRRSSRPRLRATENQ
jgi:hypothetical protein